MGPFATPHTGNNNNGSRKKPIATSVCTVCVDCSATSYINNSKAPHDWKSCLKVVLCFVVDSLIGKNILCIMISLYKCVMFFPDQTLV